MGETVVVKVFQFCNFSNASLSILMYTGSALVKHLVAIDIGDIAAL